MANESFQYFNAPGGVTRLGSTLPLSAMLAAALAGSPASAGEHPATPTPPISQPDVPTAAAKPVGTAITHGPAQGGTAPGSQSPAEVSHDLIARNTAVSPSITDAAKIMSAVAGPFGAFTLGGGLVADSLGLGSSPLNPGGASLSPADQAKVQAAFDAAIASGYSATQAQAFANDTLGQVRADAIKSGAVNSGPGDPSKSSSAPQLGSNVGAALNAGAAPGTAFANAGMAGLSGGTLNGSTAGNSGGNAGGGSGSGGNAGGGTGGNAGAGGPGNASGAGGREA